MSPSKSTRRTASRAARRGAPRQVILVVTEATSGAARPAPAGRRRRWRCRALAVVLHRRRRRRRRGSCPARAARRRRGPWPPTRHVQQRGAQLRPQPAPPGLDTPKWPKGGPGRPARLDGVEGTQPRRPRRRPRAGSAAPGSGAAEGHAADVARVDRAVVVANETSCFAWPGAANASTARASGSGPSCSMTRTLASGTGTGLAPQASKRSPKTAREPATSRVGSITCRGRARRPRPAGSGSRRPARRPRRRGRGARA